MKIISIRHIRPDKPAAGLARSRNPSPPPKVPDEPTRAQMAANFAGAMAGWLGQGFKTVPEAVYQERTALCLACEFWDGDARFGLGKCNKCGCTSLKRFLAKQACPLKKWTAV